MFGKNTLPGRTYVACRLDNFNKSASGWGYYKVIPEIKPIKTGCAKKRLQKYKAQEHIIKGENNQKHRVTFKKRKYRVIQRAKPTLLPWCIIKRQPQLDSRRRCFCKAAQLLLLLQ